MRTQVLYKKTWPKIKDLQKISGGKNLILLYDERLNSRLEFKLWAAPFAHKFSLAAGEKLKNIDTWAEHVKKILPALSGYSRKENVIVAVGGGSLGDFAGFLASVLKRGIGLVHMPSTWLAAVDSAYGGKNGLNVGDIKNQVGTIYQAQAVICVQELLLGQPRENILSAYGEVFKIGLLNGHKLYQKIIKLKELTAENLWRILPDVVAAKLKIVQRDPLETKGIRELLNLGHTLGHALEVEHRLPHGLAVHHGLSFAIEWSFRRKLMNSKNFEEIKKLLEKNKMQTLAPLASEKFKHRVLQDKKVLSGDKVKFIFIKKPGRPVIEEVPVQEFIYMAKDLGWTI